jgi:hypothetical protein
LSHKKNKKKQKKQKISSQREKISLLLRTTPAHHLHFFTASGGLAEKPEGGVNKNFNCKGSVHERFSEGSIGHR